MEKILLGVNIDHVATLRQARLTRYPDPVQAALMAEQAGADSITVHLREDRRHIQERDVELLKDMISVGLNLEMAVTDEMLGIAEKLRPDFCCLVPEQRHELTTEGGLDVRSMQHAVTNACRRLTDAGIRVSLFVDADSEQINASHIAGAAVVEIHTGQYANAVLREEKAAELDKIRRGIELARQLGLQVNAGHGLNYQNVQEIAGIAGIHELNIGHSIISRAVFTGIEQAVREMKHLMLQARLYNHPG